MIALRSRDDVRKRIHDRIRRKMSGSAERPRLNVYRSLNHIYVQLIDDANGVTLASVSSLSGKIKTGGNVAAAREVGKAVAAAVGTNMWLRAPGRAASLLGQRTTSVTRSLRVSNARFRAATAWEPRYSSVGEGYRAMAEDTKQQRRRSTA